MIKKISRWVLYALSIVLLILILTALAIRFVVFPNIDRYKEPIAKYVSKNLGQPISIGKIVTGWDGVSPHISLKQINVFDAENRIALHLNNVEANLSWLSIPMLQPRLSNLIVHQPSLTIRRKPNGSIVLAGIEVGGKGKPTFTNWLLSQNQIRIENARLTWFDDLRKAPPLSLNQLNLHLNNPVINSRFGQHEFTLSALPSLGTPHAIKINGRFVGGDIRETNTWHGNITAQLKNADISLWKPWLDYPVDIQSGLGDAKIGLDFAGNKIEQVKINTSLKSLSLKVKNQENALLADKFSGAINWSNLKNVQTLSVKQIKLLTPMGLNIDNGSGYYATSIKNTKPWVSAELNLNQFNLSLIKELSPYLRLPQNITSAINGLAPVGELSNLKLSWSGAQAKPANYAIKTGFSQLGLNVYEKIPGVSNLSGQLIANESNGELSLNSKKVMLDLRGILRWPVPADQLTGIINWKKNTDNLDINASEIFITSPHIRGTVNAKYSVKPGKTGYLDLTGKFSQGDAQYALFYYPTLLDNETLNWLDTSIKKGELKNIDVRVKGNLADFPFVNKNNQPDSKLGIFKVSAQLNNALLDYGTDWPMIEGLNLSMLFAGSGMELSASAGNMLGNRIIKSKAVINQLNAQNPLLIITGEVQGSVADGIRYINNSPVKSVAQGFTESLLTAGKGNLLLSLKIPLQDVDSAKIAGAYRVTNGVIYANAQVGLPELNNLNGTLNFTESSLSAQNISTELLGGPAKFSLKTEANKTIRITANGRVNDAGIKKIMSNRLTDSLLGNAEWAGEINIKQPLIDMNIRSNLLGMAITLPAPFNKAADQAMTLNIDKKQDSTSKDIISLNLGNIVSARLLRSEIAGNLAIERGDIGINMPAAMPTQAGLFLHGKLDYVDADEWITLLDQSEPTSSVAKSQSTFLAINKAEVAVQKLDIFGRRINALKLSAQPNNAGFKMAVNSLELTGDMQWQPQQNNLNTGKIVARFKNLTISKAISALDTTRDTTKDTARTKKDFRKLAQAYPALDIVADNFELGGNKLGALSLNAFENGEDWVIQKLNITNDDSTLNVQGNWHNWARNPNTNLVVSMSSTNVGKTFKRFGQPDALKGGAAEINGQINWPGSPHDFDTAQLNGNLTFLATKGQILKVKPGVGRLFGLLTLQSLPRRLSLDFRDLFNDGFAYDTISATAKIDNGILRSDNFFMDGPAAEATIKGETNLKAETQYLKVKVRPHISDTLSLAALAGGPIVGAAAFVAQKILKDPFNKIVGSEYIITGTWDYPVELKSDSDNKNAPNSDSPLTP